MISHRVNAFVISTVFIAALTGCADGGGSPLSGGISSGGTATGHSDTACMSGKNWDLDVQDAANQLLTELQSHGSPATSSIGSGSQQLYFHEAGTMGSTTDLTFAVVAPLGNGLTMTLTQHQAGTANSDWVWIDDTNVIGFNDWISNYTVSNTVDINGTESQSATPLPSGGADGSNMTVVCSGDSLTTSSVGSPFTMHWTAEH